MSQRDPDLQRKWPREPWVLTHVDPQSSEIERLIDALLYLEAHAATVRQELQEKHGKQRPPWVHPDHDEKSATYLEIAHQLVAAHRRAPYWKLWQAPLADEIVRYRSNLRFMFMEGRKVAKRHGERGAMRLLEAIPPPSDAKIMEKARDLMVEVLDEKKQPLVAAIELTEMMIKIRREVNTSRDFVRQGADKQATSAPKDDDTFIQTVETILWLLDEEAASTAESAEAATP
jgi:hypothetical protein